MRHCWVEMRADGQLIDTVFVDDDWYVMAIITAGPPYDEAPPGTRGMSFWLREDANLFTHRKSVLITEENAIDLIEHVTVAGGVMSAKFRATKDMEVDPHKITMFIGYASVPENYKEYFEE